MLLLTTCTHVLGRAKTGITMTNGMERAPWQQSMAPLSQYSSTIAVHLPCCKPPRHLVTGPHRRHGCGRQPPSQAPVSAADGVMLHRQFASSKQCELWYLSTLS